VIDGEPADRRPRQRPGRGGEAAIDAGRPVGREGRIAGQQLIGAVAPERDRNLGPREPAQQVRRQDRGVAEWLVEPGHDLGYQLVNGRCREDPLVMIGPQMVGDRAGVPALVEAGVFEPDRVRPDFPRRHDLGQGCRDARRIDPPREEDPERHVRPPMPPHGRTKVVPEPRGRLGERRRPRFGHHRGRVPVAKQRRLSSLPDQKMCGRELADALPDRVGGRDVLIEEIAHQAGSVEPAGDVGVLEQGLRFRAEDKAAAGRLRIEQRLLPHPVPRQDQAASA